MGNHRGVIPPVHHPRYRAHDLYSKRLYACVRIYQWVYINVRTVRRLLVPRYTLALFSLLVHRRK